MRLLDGADRGRVTTSSRPAPPRVLFEAGGDDPQGWWPVARLDGPTDAAEQAALAAHGRRAPDGTLELEGMAGGWVRAVPVGGGTPLVLQGVLATCGLELDPAVGGARLGLVELPFTPGPDDLALVSREALAQAWTDAVVSDGAPTPVALSVRTRGRTRCVVLVCSQSVPPARPDAWARFAGLRLIIPGDVQRAAEAAGAPGLFADAGRVPRGRFSIAYVDRPGVAVLPGRDVALPVTVPAGASRLEAFAGLVPDGLLATGLGVQLRAELRAPGAPGTPPLASWSVDLVAADTRAARWQPFGGPLPAAAAGRDLELTLSARAEGPGACLPVVGTPRLVPAHPRRPGPNVLIVSLDTLRADHLGCYGYDRPTSPNLDALAADAQLFEQVWTQGPYTLPAHMSLFSGQFPTMHGVSTDGDVLDPGRTRLLAEVLAKAGWTTAAFTGGGYVHPDYGFARGFDRYSSLEPLANLESPRVQGMLARARNFDPAMFTTCTPEVVARWIGAHRDEPFLLFFHTYAVHQFDPPREDVEALGLDVPPREPDDEVQRYVAAFETPPPDVLARITDLYDATVHQADRAVGVLLDALARQDLLERTIVVVTSDHGKELGDHGLVAHGHSLHEELLHVPLIVRVPGQPPRRVAEPAMLVDVVPTLLAALGLPAPDDLQGVDLLAPHGRRLLWAEVDTSYREAALRDGTLKTIRALPSRQGDPPRDPEERAFDLAADPHELHPLPPDPERRRAVDAFRLALESLAAARASAHGPAAGDGPGEAVRAQLAELGYLGRDARSPP